MSYLVSIEGAPSFYATDYTWWLNRYKRTQNISSVSVIYIINFGNIDFASAFIEGLRCYSNITVIQHGTEVVIYWQ